MKLRGTVALVTGGSKGIGRAIGQRLAREGAEVVLNARTAGVLDSAVQALRAEGLAVEGEPGDIGSEADVERIVASVTKRHGRIDILVNNAGMGIFNPVTQLSVVEFDSMWQTNMRGAFLASKAVIPHMIRTGGGDVVFISSLAGKNAIKGGAGYCATKWAMRGFASSLMLEVREHRIRVVTIFPGSVDTGFSSNTTGRPQITQPEDVAEGVLLAVTAPGRAMFSEIDVRPTIPAKG